MIETIEVLEDYPNTCPYDGSRTELFAGCIETCPSCDRIFSFEGVLES